MVNTYTLSRLLDGHFGWKMSVLPFVFLAMQADFACLHMFSELGVSFHASRNRTQGLLKACFTRMFKIMVVPVDTVYVLVHPFMQVCVDCHHGQGLQ